MQASLPRFRRAARLLAPLVLLHATHVRAASPSWLTAHDADIRALVARMTLQEKIGQMTQPDLRAIKDFSDIENLCLGAILSGGSSDPKGGNTMKDWAGLYRSVQNRTEKTRLGIPLLYGIDAVHGHNNVLGAVIFPHNIGLGCTRNPELVAQAARITAREMRATGIQWNFAPCLAVPLDIRWGRTYEGFSEDPELVAALGRAAVIGLQGENLAGREAVLGCAKHFIADGGTTFGTAGAGGLLDQGDARISEAVLRAVHMAGYPAAIDAGVGTVMPSFSSWNGVKCSGSRFLLTDLLKEELGFKGFVISDYNAIDQLVPAGPGAERLSSNNASGQVKTANYKKCIEISINAGLDMVMVTDRYRDFIRLLQELVQEGRVPVARIDDAVTRILRVKFAMGLMKRGPALAPDPSFQREFGSSSHRAVAREAVRQSLVLLKNQGAVLPLSRGMDRIHVSGRGADDLGMQCGGWTVSWQGARGPVTTGGTTILEALRSAAGKKLSITTDQDGSAAGASAIVVAIGEEPYAEMKGDRSEPGVSPQDLAAVAKAKSFGVPVIVVVLSGRPLILGPVEKQADAIVAAWLPGTEGHGVADILFGDAKPTGRLSFTWPRSVEQIPRDGVSAVSDTPLYPLGFGLDY